MSWAFVYEQDGHRFQAGWEMNHGMMWVSFRTIQVLVREGLVSPIPESKLVPIKYGWD
ncbi:hypothetical protein QEZ48_14875 [Aquamicrobium lusatiense]|uniref:hypothetical protein n=1 Tax=Aquamicrobium lusatiense TaxID=89772 RepID=UPI002458BA9C|nr:hypothetical protein [Aquamicrobium lusatiense]MDH4992101.1 hypothetical protein [Aquamicrobium lusatiense]